MPFDQRVYSEIIEKQSDATLLSLLHSFPDVVFVISPEGTLLDANATFFFRYTGNEKRLGINVFDLLPPELAAERRKMVQKSVHTDRLVAFDDEVDGKLFRSTIYPYKSAEGNVNRLLILAQDITERKLAEAELHKLNRLLLVIDQCNKALIHADNENELLQKICSIIVESNGFLMAWVGYKLDDEAKSLHTAACAGHTGDYFETTVISWADDQYGQGPAGTAIRRGQPVSVNHILTDPQFNLWRTQAIKNGYEAVLSLPLSVDKTVIGALTIYSGLPDAFNRAEIIQLTSLADNLAFGIKMQRSRDELKKSEQINAFRFRILQMADTQSIEELLMTTLDEAERMTESEMGFFFFVAEDQNTLLLQAVSSNTLINICTAEEKGQHYPLDKDCVWADALRKRKAIIHNDYTALKHCKGMPDGLASVKRELMVPVCREGKIVAIMAVGNRPRNYDDRDIRHVELIASHTWDIVAKKIADDEKKTLAAQLQQAMKMEMIGQLAAGIAHEINNPLNFITLNAHALLEDFNDLGAFMHQYRPIIEKAERFPAIFEEVEQLREEAGRLDIDELLNSIPEALEKLRIGVERISTITHSMRSYSFKNGSEQLFAFDLNKAIHEALVIAKHEYSQIATIALMLEELPQLFCDPAKISQVILNLIINSSHAIKSQNRSAPGKIEIKTWVSGESISCSITDDGPGIPETVIGRIFEPFFTTKEPGKGTGLGLSICYDIIVKKHQGNLSATCLEEGGTAFTFTLPMQTVPSA